ncbi:MAG: hypothetical protein KBF26_01320 [Opitutaceae bacterium]|nr:hypothetical protein [Opitutaceae bacterium]
MDAAHSRCADSFTRRFCAAMDSPRKALLVASLADSLADISRHLSPSRKGQLLDEASLAKIVSLSGADEATPAKYKGGPRWLDELLEEAIALGESEEHVLQLIRGKLEDYLAVKKAEKQSSKR